MTGISRVDRERRLFWALPLLLAMLLGYPAIALSQQVAHLGLTAAADAGVPDAPEPQRAGTPKMQAPVSGSAGAPTILAPGLPQAGADGGTQGSVQGLITDRDGVPYQGVRVVLTRSISASPSPGAMADVRTETSDSSGRYQFRSVAPGPFQITVASDGFATQIRTGTLNPGESYEAPAIALHLAAAGVEVQVTASQHDVAQAQLTEEEQQRVLGFIPNFYVVYAPNAMPLSTKQKFDLAWRYSIDPVSFLSAAVFAGIEQDEDDFKGYGQGSEGYAKRFGAVYADGFIGSMLGSAILPSLLKQDPRYFYKGVGSKKSRALYAVESSFICRGDNGKRQFNYSGIFGGLGAAGISNIYYPASDRNGAGLTFENTLIGIATGAAQNLFQEFVVRKLTPRLPNYGSSSNGPSRPQNP